MAKKKRGRLRRFNGTGSVYMLSGRRAKPWVARINTGRGEPGKYKYQYTYHKTNTEAVLAIPNMLKGIMETPKSKATVSQIWEQFKSMRYPKLTESTINGYNQSYAHWGNLHDSEIVQLRASDLQEIINAKQEMSYSHLSKMRALMVSLFETALRDDIVSKNYASLVELPKGEPESTRRAFTEDEILRIAAAAERGVPYADLVLFMCYTGWRPTEMCLLTKDSIDLENWYITGGIKTQAGKNRAVPIHQSIRGIVLKWLGKNNITLFSDEKGLPLDKDKWRNRFLTAMKTIGIAEDVVPYTTRHTCASILHAAGADHLSIAKILGHKDYKITAMRYTHLDLKALKSAIDLLK